MQKNIVTLQKGLLSKNRLAMESDSKGRRFGTQRDQVYPNFTLSLPLIRVSFGLYLDFIAGSKAQFMP